MSTTLEYSVLYALTHGSLLPDQVKPHLTTFSKPGKAVYQAVKWFLERGQLPPFELASVEAACVQQFGTSTLETEAYMRAVKSHTSGKEILEVLRGASEKVKLLEMQQAIIKQTAEGVFDPAAFDTILKDSKGVGDSLVSLAEESEQWEAQGDDGKQGKIDVGGRLPTLQQETGGLGGFWVIGGTPGVGKSTLAWQLALLAGETRPVLYYDLENTKRVLYSRTVRSVDGNVDEARKRLRRIRVRTNPRGLFADVQQLTEPGVIAVDSLQKLPSNIHLKRESIEEWLSRLDRLKQDGHIIIVVSQLNRGEGNYKGTNDIEHTADVGLKMDADEDNVSISNLYIEKNRHGEYLGILCQLRRENIWLMKE